MWRNSESMGVKHKIASPEHTYCTVLLDVYRRAREAAEHVTEMAGGAIKSACDIGRAVRTVPGLAEFVKARAEMATGMKKVANAYRRWVISDPENRRYAGSLDNAAHCTGTFAAHPGMPGNTSEVKRIIRGRVDKPRSIQRILPAGQGPAPRRCCRPSMPPAPPVCSRVTWLPAAAAVGIWSRAAPKTGCPASRRTHRSRNSWIYCHPRTDVPGGCRTHTGQQGHRLGGLNSYRILTDPQSQD